MIDDLDKAVARQAEIDATLPALQKERDDLEITIRMIRKLRGVEVPEALAVSAPKRGRKRSVDGIPGQHAKVLRLLRDNGGSMERNALKEAVNLERDEPLSDGSYASLISKMASAERVRRVGKTIYLTQENQGGADVS
ncbi:hypothetical protein [Sphingomonas sp. dw_22]|uniref:hypothetical protein n=1 Tax=Sphingomonas sp. dw_22 TaxID=2721175 RepID=UPI001BD3A379|nr:hypothetical protein [Sphingomonas sp. dw_22]